MKTFKNIITAGLLSGVVMAFTLSSCQKGFDANTYKPSKPLPTYGGFSNSKDIEPANLVAYWPFNGSLVDSISQTAAVGTGTSFSTGVKGKGLQGSTTGYAVTNTPAAVKSLHSFTISTWVNMPLNTGATGIVSVAHSQNFWGNFDIFFDNGGTATTGVLKVHVYNNAAVTTGVDAWEGGYTVANPWNKWTNIIVTYDDVASTVTVYYNGAQAGTNTVPTFTPLDWSKANQMVFGTLQFQTNPSLTTNTGSQGWAANVNGVIDQVRVYSTVLNASEITGLYNLEKAGR
ncbi:LamG domain-containing protein [Mucilaginibacter sp.]|uniref:LamG domain-containing protein n=1 Tax=Mucilaginibacter sp. TaxID=1882438 RepID=UPI003D0CD793